MSIVCLLYLGCYLLFNLATLVRLLDYGRDERDGFEALIQMSVRGVAKHGSN